MTAGTDLRAARRAKGWSLRELARRACITHGAVLYWEAKSQVDLRSHAPSRIAQVLGMKLPVNFSTVTRARDGVLAFCPFIPKAKPTHTRCGARTRKGHPCRARPEPGRTRCRFHGGKSTGPRTPEGKARVAEAQRNRWARWRQGH